MNAWSQRLSRVAVMASSLVLGMATMDVSAQSIVSTGQSFISARLLPGQTGEDGSRLAGLRLTMTPGWKTYWRAPGRAGIPPRFDWSGSDNVASVEVLWPRPLVFESFGMRTVGYEEEVLLPLRVTPERLGEDMRLTLSAELGVCRDICVLEEVAVEEAIPADLRSIGYREISRAMRRIPVQAAEVGVAMEGCRITGSQGSWTLEAEIASDRFAETPEILVEGSERLWVFESSTQASGNTVLVTAELQVPAGTSWIDRSVLRFTVLGADYAADIQGCSASAG
ncbi:MAG: protein-disulfide reductase DsbD domain-containing protein [Pseudomonadota bacterium]